MRSATVTCIFPWPRAVTCWRTSASSYPLLTWRCSTSEARDGPQPADGGAVAARHHGSGAAARALEVRGQAIAEYFVSEVLDQQPPELAQFMLDTSILTGVMTADACAAVTGRQDAAALLHAIDAAHLFLVALDNDRTSFRYHHLVRRVLRAELRARDRAREQALQLRAAEWFEATGRHGVRPTISWPPGRPTGPWPSYRTGS